MVRSAGVLLLDGTASIVGGGKADVFVRMETLRKSGIVVLHEDEKLRVALTEGSKGKHALWGRPLTARNPSRFRKASSTASELAWSPAPQELIIRFADAIRDIVRQRRSDILAGWIPFIP
jgi:cold shock CspA family protein